jgi:hypothetical protein
VRIDVQTKKPGLKFKKVWDERVNMRYHEQSFPVVSKQNLIAAKEEAGREVDIEDVKILELGNDDN